MGGHVTKFGLRTNNERWCVKFLRYILKVTKHTPSFSFLLFYYLEYVQNGDISWTMHMGNILALAEQKEWFLDRSLGPLDISTVCFHSHTFLGPCHWCRSQGLGWLMWGTNPLLFRERLQAHEIPPYYVLTCQGWGFWWDCISAFPTCLGVVLLSLVMDKAVQLVFSSSSVGMNPNVAVDLVHLWEEVR